MLSAAHLLASKQGSHDSKAAIRTPVKKVPCKQLTETAAKIGQVLEPPSSRRPALAVSLDMENNTLTCKLPSPDLQRRNNMLLQEAKQCHDSSDLQQVMSTVTMGQKADISC